MKIVQHIKEKIKNDMDGAYDYAILKVKHIIFIKYVVIQDITYIVLCLKYDCRINKKKFEFFDISGPNNNEWK